MAPELNVILLHPETDSPQVPCPRDIWNGMMSHDGALYMFGGATTKYGPATKEGDLGTLGTLNDLWRYSPDQDSWELVEEDDGRAGCSEIEVRPSGRVLPAWVPVGEALYLFGGLSVLDVGWKAALLNDLWRYDPNRSGWERLESHSDTPLLHPGDAPGRRPTTLSAMGAAVIGTDIYLMNGWAGTMGDLPSVVMDPHLWRYSTVARNWTLLGPEKFEDPDWPPKRYCPCFTAWKGRLYLWGGRDSMDLSPEWFNDLWVYDPGSGEWECLMENTPDDPGRPSGRYGSGHAAEEGRWFVFGGFGSVGSNGPQLNDLWSYSFEEEKWSCLLQHDGSKDYSRTATRPGVRRVPAMTALNGSLYLFAGIDLASGPNDDGPTCAFNDFWKLRLTD